MYKQLLIKFEINKYRSPFSFPSRLFSSWLLFFADLHYALCCLGLLGYLFGFYVIIFWTVFVVLVVILRDVDVIFAICLFLFFRFRRLSRLEIFGEILFAFFREVISNRLRILSVPNRDFTLGASSCQYPGFIHVKLERVEFSLFAVKLTNRCSGSWNKGINIPDADLFIDSNSS